MTRELPTGAAINEAIAIAMRSDPDVILMGEDVAGGGDRSKEGRAKYILEVSTGTEAFYDLVGDPGEGSSVLDAQQAAVEVCRSRVAPMKASVDGC